MASPERVTRTFTAPARRPHIALEMTRTFAAAASLRPLLPNFVLRHAIDAVTLELDRRATVVVDQYHAPEAVDVVADALAAYFFATTKKTKSRPTKSALHDLLTSAYVTPATTPKLDVVIDAYTLEGIDADALCWALIRLETTWHTKLIWLQANRIARNQSNVNPSDLFGWGWQGLRMALRQYDPSVYAFSTYACTRINGAMRDGIRREGPIPKRLTTFVRKVSAAEEDLAQSLGRAPSLAELSQHLGSTLEQLALAYRCAPTASLDARLETNTLGDAAVATSPEPAQAVVTTEFYDALTTALETLPVEEREAVQLLLIEEHSIARARQLSGATTEQLQKRLSSGRARLAEMLSEFRVPSYA